MRHVFLALGLTITLAAVGCSGTRFGFVSKNPAPTLPSERPTVEGLVEYLNRNGRQLQSLECNNVDIDYRQGLQSYGVDAKLACQKPRNFRLGAFAVGSQQVDIGSNGQEFWYWIAKADPPYIYRCSYQDFERGVALPFPFQPEWIMEALGMAEYGPPEKYRLVEQKTSWELVEQSRNSQGQLVRKVTEFSKGPNRIQVRGYRLLDMHNKEIYSAQVKDVHVIGGMVVPHRITFNWPDQKLSMTLKLGRSSDQVVLNGQIPPERATALFTRPTMPGIATVDLAEVQRRAAGGIERTGGTIR